MPPKSNNNLMEKFCENFNKYWNKALKPYSVDYFSRLSISDLVELKKVVSSINNIITIKTSLSFVEVLFKSELITEDIKKEMVKNIESTSPNSNGYDIEYDDQDGVKILAEVKCNIPVKDKGYTYGKKQSEGIINDIKGLKNKKKKSKISDVSDFYRFMVVLGDNECVKTAMKKLIDQDCIDFGSHSKLSELDKNKIHIVYIPYQDIDINNSLVPTEELP